VRIIREPDCLCPARRLPLKIASFCSNGTFAVVALTVLFTLGCQSNSAQSGSAANLSGPPVQSAFWGARLPRKCAPVTAPPTAAQVPALVQCYMERETREFENLVQNIQGIQMDGTRGVVLSDAGDNIDNSAKIQMFHGSNDYYTCDPINESVMHNTGKNCAYIRSANVTGSCWMVHDHSYHCEMHFLVGPDGRANTYPGQPGPTAY